MLTIISTLIVIGFLAISLSSFYVSRSGSIDALVQTELPLTSDNIYTEIQRDLLTPQIVSSVMANDSFVRDWIKTGEKDQSAIKEYLTNIVKKYNAFTAFLVVEESRNFYVPQGFVRKVSEQEHRDKWYFRVRSHDKEVEVNIDPAEAHNDQLTIFINVRMLDNDSQFIAAIGLGLNMDLFKTRLNHYEEKYGNR